MAVELVTIEGIELVATGTYDLSTGEHTFTAEELADAVRAYETEPAVNAPRIKLGHVDVRAGFDGETLDGEPALGVFENLRLSADGQKVVADAVVPQWLADSWEWAFPARSIEGALGWQSKPSGKKYELMITAVALLGTELPGVATLDDLRELLSENGPVAASDPVVAIAAAQARPDRVVAGMDQDLVRRRFYDALESGAVEAPEEAGPTFGWWVRSLRLEDGGQVVLIVDDQEGHLYRVPFSVDGDEVTFDDPERVVEQYVTASSVSREARVPIGVWASREQSRAIVQAKREDPTVNIAHLRETLGLTAEQLPDDATDEQINAALEQRIADARAETPAPNPPEPGQGDPPGEPETEGDNEGTPDAPGQHEAQVPVTASALPDGVVAIDAAELATLRAGAQTAQTLAAAQAESEREQTLAAAMAEGRFPPARLDAYRQAWTTDPDGTRTLLTASVEQGGLAPGLVPVEARGGAPQDGDLTDEAYPQEWLAEHERVRASGTPTAVPGAVRIVQEA